MKERVLIVFALVMVFGVSSVFAQAGAKEDFKPYENGKLRMVIVGSSVAWGAGATNDHGWARMLEDTLEATGRWDVINKSIGGNRTSDVLGRPDRDVLVYKPNVVLIGLSLANEGFGGNGEVQPIYTSFRNGLRKIVQILQANGITTVVCNCYPNGNYGPEKYALVQQMNFEIATWPVPSINFFAGVNNGQGQWSKAHFSDPGHPNDIGHQEMYYTIPISLFDSYTGEHLTRQIDNPSGVHVSAEQNAAPLQCMVDYDLHSYTILVDVQFDTIKPGVIVASDNGLTLSINADGCLEYKHRGDPVRTSEPLIAGKRYTISLAVAHNENMATLSVNGQNARQMPYNPGAAKTLYFGGTKDAPGISATFRNLLIYRGALSPEAITYINEGNIMNSSLQLYAPLNDPIVMEGSRLMNLAPTSSYLLVTSKDCRK